MSRKEPTVSDIHRAGHVSAVYPERGTATVEFRDRSGLVSKELQMGQRNTLKNKDESHYDVGEHVLCAFYGNGLSEGVILCALYDTKNPPSVGDQDKRTVIFEDGTHLEYDRKEHKLTGQVAGDVDLQVEKDVAIETGGNVTVNAGGNVQIDAAGGVSIAAGGNGTVLSGNFSMIGNLDVTGNINASGTIIDGGGNTNHHTH